MLFGFLTLELFLQGYFNFIYADYELKRWHLYVLLDIMVLGIVMFSNTYLQLKKNIPIMHKGLLIFLIFVLILTLASMFDIVSTTTHRFSLAFAFLLIIALGFYATYRKITQAKYYVFGWLFLFLYILTEASAQIGFYSFFESYPNSSKLFIFFEALIFSIALSARIRLLEREKQNISYRLFKQEKQASHRLKLKVKERTEELEKSLEEKHVLAKEVHHRVKNNLQIIISLLRLQSDESNNKLLQQILEESENRIRAISNVHELLYENETLQHINTQIYFEQLAQDIQASLGKNHNIKLIIDAKASLSMEKAIYCGLIANELITNAFKYAFNGNEGVLNILFKKNNGFTYIISDNGKGISSDARDNLGMVLVKTLVKKQLKGSIVIDNTNGTKYIIKFGSDK